MTMQRLDQFAQSLVRMVRDAAIRSCDDLLLPQANAPIAHRWRASGATAAAIKVVIPGVVDEVLFAFLRAVDEGALRLKFVADDGGTVELTEDGLGELSGWYMGSGGWRASFSEERYDDDCGVG